MPRRSRLTSIVRIVPLCSVLYCLLAALPYGSQLCRAHNIETLKERVEELYAAGQYGEAETAAKALLPIIGKKEGTGSAIWLDVAERLATIFRRQKRYDEAISLFLRVVEGRKSVLGRKHPKVAKALSGLADIYWEQGRKREAKAIWKKGLRALPRSPSMPRFATRPHTTRSDPRDDLRHQAETFVQKGDVTSALSTYRRLLAQEKRLSGEMNSLTLEATIGLELRLKKYGRADEEKQRLVRIWRKDVEWMLFGKELILVGNIVRLAKAYEGAGHFRGAAELFETADEIRQAKFGATHPETITGLVDLGRAYENGGWIAKAVEAYRRAANAETTRYVNLSTTEQGRLPLTLARRNYENLVRALFLLELAQPSRKQSIAAEAFEVAQRANMTSAAVALSQMSARTGQGPSGVSRLVRELQDRQSEWLALDRAITRMLADQASKSNGEKLGGLRSRFRSVGRAIERINKAIAREHPGYAGMIGKKVISVDTAQRLLGNREALVSMLVTQDHTYIWAVTKTAMSWKRAGLGHRALSDKVQALRVGLDEFAAEKRGFKALVAENGQGLPFNLQEAHDLYQKLLGAIEPDIRNKRHLLIALSGSLTALPFQVLVTKKPDRALTDYAGYARADWLINRHALSVLPSIASLKALREHALKNRRGSSPYIGFGNPLLLGPSGRDKSAWARQSCPHRGGVRVAGINRAPGDIAALFRNGRGHLEAIRHQHPLPETAYELCAVADLSKAPGSAVYLGRRATERQVKRLSLNSTLRKARIVHFATHGLLSGETQRLMKRKAEPALLLTPPDVASEIDDGLLTASEVAGLKLNADWVILSACNTAAGGYTGAEALSGLARSFFYAGARALLVSHWYVNSDATVKLITHAFKAIERKPTLGQSEAMRQAMLALIREGGANAHPSNWAPFVLVGEGGK